MKVIFLLLTQIFVFFGYINAYKILMLTPLGSKSHLNAFTGMFKQLAEEGHEVTFVSAYGRSKKMKNIRDIVIPAQYGASTFVKNVFTDGSSGPMSNLLMNCPQMCVDSLATDVIQNLKKEHFDLVLLTVFLSDCYLSLVHTFKAPLAYVSPAAFVGPFSDTVANPYFISLSGNVLLEGKFPFGFFYRIKATLVDAVFGAFWHSYTIPKMESLCRQSGACPPDMPPFQEFRANSSIAFANSIKLLNPSPVPDMPHIIYAGGSHCGPAKPLPQELDKWVRESGEDGFIFFSLGSAVTPSDMPESARKIFINVFGRLKQRVLWKWDSDMNDLPSNVKLGKWLPQQDILAHPKMRLFISHGGLLSVMETTYHGARILGMPLFADQYNNIQEGVTEGWAQSIHWKDLTEELLEKKITETIKNNDMTGIIAQRARIMNDQPKSPKEEVVYWVEYILRHNGAPHLRSPVHNMPLYVLYNLDVWLSIFTILGLLIITFCYTVMAIFRRCFLAKRPRAVTAYHAFQ